MSIDRTHDQVLAQTVEIVSSYVGNNTLPIGEIPALIGHIYKALNDVGTAPTANAPTASNAKPQPAVNAKKSIFPDYIICLEDGKKLKMLKRHLKTSYNMTPDQYRQRWSLGNNYPMVAPNYARQRSKLAKQIGLGTRSRRRA